MSREREKYGATVTVVNLETGEWGTVVHTGTTTIEALRVIVERVDALGPAWRISCISTPVTILRDLDAARLPVDGKLARRHHTATPATPEATMLARVGRLDLLVPRPFRAARYEGTGSLTFKYAEDSEAQTLGVLAPGLRDG